MHFFRRLSKPIAHILTLGVLAMSLHMPLAHAGLATTESVVAGDASQRERVASFFNRDDVKSELLARGVAPEQVQARVNALTNEEVATLANRIDELPAGAGLGSVLGVALIVFLVLVFTDIMGWTDVFPFTKKGSGKK